MRSYPHIGDVVVESLDEYHYLEVKAKCSKMREQSDYQTVDRDEVREGSNQEDLDQVRLTLIRIRMEIWPKKIRMNIRTKEILMSISRKKIHVGVRRG